MIALLLLLLATPPARHIVSSKPPVIVTTIKPAQAYVIEQTGSIVTCDDVNYGLYVQPVGNKGQIGFYYVMPGQIIRATDKINYIAACLLVK